MEFVDHSPSLEQYWRAIVLFGQNTATYKFALAEVLLELAQKGRGSARLEELAAPFSSALCRHLKLQDKQSTSHRNTFLDACRRFNQGQLDQTGLIDATLNQGSGGFRYVFDAFHVVQRKVLPVRFYHKTADGLVLTDELMGLAEKSSVKDLAEEGEARWRLVETAWSLDLPSKLVRVEHDQTSGLIFTRSKDRRINVTRARSALSGYQKGRCFHCFGPIEIHSGSGTMADVDHFFPWTLMASGVMQGLDNVWNLVLACALCNRGTGGKFDSVPSVGLLDRLHRRNNYLITSHHPLRETLMAQTGKTGEQRRQFLQHAYNEARANLIHVWEPAPRGPADF